MLLAAGWPLEWNSNGAVGSSEIVRLESPACQKKGRCEQGCTRARQGQDEGIAANRVMADSLK